MFRQLSRHQSGGGFNELVGNLCLDRPSAAVGATQAMWHCQGDAPTEVPFISDTARNTLTIGASDLPVARAKCLMSLKSPAKLVGSFAVSRPGERIAPNISGPNSRKAGTAIVRSYILSHENVTSLAIDRMVLRALLIRLRIDQHFARVSRRSALRFGG